MGGGVSMPEKKAIGLVLNRMEETPLWEAVNGSSEPVLITGRVLVKTTLVIPLCGERGVYHRSQCNEYVNGKISEDDEGIDDVEFVDQFEIVDMYNPSVRVTVPIGQVKSYFDLCPQKRNMSSAKNSQQLEPSQLKFMSKHGYEAEKFASYGMTMKSLEFSEEKILLGQPISIVCTIKNKCVASIGGSNRKFATKKNWGEIEIMAWSSLFRKASGIIITDKYKVPTTRTNFTPIYEQQHAQLSGLSGLSGSSGLDTTQEDDEGQYYEPLYYGQNKYGIEPSTLQLPWEHQQQNQRVSSTLTHVTRTDSSSSSC